MASPQPAHERIPRKRKRSLPDSNVLDKSLENATHSPPTKKTGRTKKPGKKPSSEHSPAIDESNWPPRFVLLEQTHRALNLVFTFCSARKYLATTFDTIKTAVEGHTKRDLCHEDIAAIKALVPKAIHFAYVDPAALQVQVLGDASNIKGKRETDFRLDDPKAKDPSAKDFGDPNKEVLLFEFLDGDLKRQVQDKKTGEPTNPNRRLRYEDLKMPVYSQKQMTNLIIRRTSNFKTAVSAFLGQCAAQNDDPGDKIDELLKSHMPVPSDKPSFLEMQKRFSMLPAAIPAERQTIAEIVSELKEAEWYTGQIVPDGHRIFKAQLPIYGDLKFQLSQSMVNALYNARNITQLYSHQIEAINNLYDRHHVIISTSTSSGKSLIYQIPVLHELEKDPNTRAMYIFPTKALAQDQRRSLKEILGYMDGMQDLVVETFDGDTPMADRNFIRDEARICITNPDMLHITILPQEESWRTFLKNLKFVVVDELHVYNGLFGSHVGFIMRRLRRICSAVGNNKIRFISCSATVANPEAHMKAIFGVEDVRLTDFDGSPSGQKEFLCWNTPFKDPADPKSGRGDALAESARLFCQLILRGVRVIAFCRVRNMCESLVGAVKSELESLDRADVMARVMGYRGGYTTQDRRRIEREMFEGKLLGIVATNALELGIDIGSLDAVITVGFPYSISNLRQQSGRAGRRNKDSLSILVGDCFPTDQYYMENPEEIFSKPNCELQVDLENILVLEGHLQCAAYEMPIRPDVDKIYFGSNLPVIAEQRLVKDKLGFYHCSERFRPRPSKFVPIRDTEDGHFAVVDITNGRNEVIEEVEPSRAFFTIYEGGIFLHQGNKYLVKELSTDSLIARVERVNVEWTTAQRDFTDVDPIETEAIRRIPGSASRAFFGAIMIRAVVFGYFKMDKRRRVLDAVEVDNPPIEILSKGMWLDVPKRAIEILNARRINVAGAIHAAEHAMLSLMPNFVISMPGDVRTECKNAQKEFAKMVSSRKRPARLIFYDAKGGAGGSGISTKAFEFVDLLLRQACERIDACHCSEGCLECVCSERCKEQNVVMSKAGSGVVIKALLGRHIDVDALPWGPEELAPAGHETVVLATEVLPRSGARVDTLEIKREIDEGGAMVGK
ncbi:MAG: hypothetical protein M1829_002019 [Trizodia sp. TS-e1964]|nr:MAG: hypothetical protein M1829_002019 [Trizodia sp. TS-e1964]